MTQDTPLTPSVRFLEPQAVAEVYDMLTPAECLELVSAGLSADSNDGGLYQHGTGGTTYGDARKSRVAWLRRPNDPIVRRIFQMLVQINNEHFDFQIKFKADIGLQFTIYEPGGHYAWHRDWNVMQLANRKLSIVLQLTDPKEYGGGGLQIFNGHYDSPYEAPRAQGSMLVFPSFMMHRVVPVDWGTRYSLVLWATGPKLQ